MNNITIVFYRFLVLCLGVLAFVLFLEVRFFKNETNKMIATRSEYQLYKQRYQKLLLDYIELKKSIAQINSIELFDKEFYENNYAENPIVWVNRESDYLRSSALDFAKIQSMPSVFTTLYNEDEWLVGQGLAHYQPTAQKAKTGTRRTSNKKTGVTTASVSRKEINRDIALHWPIDRKLFWISSIFGPRKKANNTWGFHYGIDMAALKGIPVKAAHSGTIVQAGPANGYGNMIVIRHSQKYCTRYAHLDTIGVSIGQLVKTGQVIGTVGNTGLVRGKNGAENAHHLHFELLVHGKQINPLTLLS